MSFNAKFPGSECVVCDEPIHVGQEVEFNDRRDLMHVICPESLTVAGTRRETCPHCFCEIPPIGTCDCRE